MVWIVFLTSISSFRSCKEDFIPRAVSSTPPDGLFGGVTGGRSCGLRSRVSAKAASNLLLLSSSRRVVGRLGDAFLRRGVVGLGDELLEGVGLLENSACGFVVGTPGTRTYQVWYRNAAAFCNAETFNLTNGVEVVWVP